METKKIMGWFCIVFIVATALILVLPWLFIQAPADSQYNKKFGAHVTMAHDQATFEGMKTQVMMLWKNMNDTFSGWDLDHTYSTWWYPDQTYESSLGAQRDYFTQLVISIDRYTILYQEKVLNATNPTLLEDWYYKAMSSLRDEMTREGDLDWALNGAWYLNLAPTAYWMDWWRLPLLGIFVCMAIICGLVGVGVFD